MILKSLLFHCEHITPCSSVRNVQVTDSGIKSSSLDQINIKIKQYQYSPFNPVLLYLHYHYTSATINIFHNCMCINFLIGYHSKALRFPSVSVLLFYYATPFKIVWILAATQQLHFLTSPCNLIFKRAINSPFSKCIFILYYFMIGKCGRTILDTLQT